jgi:hypothetical protein
LDLTLAKLPRENPLGIGEVITKDNPYLNEVIKFMNLFPFESIVSRTKSEIHFPLKPIDLAKNL